MCERQFRLEVIVDVQDVERFRPFIEERFGQQRELLMEQLGPGWQVGEPDICEEATARIDGDVNAIPTLSIKGVWTAQAVA